MTDPADQSRASEALKLQAMEWLVRLTSGGATAGDVRALEQWRRRSPAHEEAFAIASRLWRSLGPAMEELAQGLGPTAARRGAATPRLGRRAFLAGALTASVAAAGYALVRPPLGLWPSLSELSGNYRTGTGERRQIATPAGASLELNTRTALNIRSDAAEVDQVELISGEALVATRALPRPIELIAGGGRARGSDAVFDVRWDGGRVRVTGLSGLVRVVHRGEEVVLGENRQVAYDRQGLGPIRAVDSAAVTAWRRGYLVFQDEPLEGVIEEVNRYRPGRIILANPELERRRVTARFRLDRLADVVTHLHEVFGARPRTLPGGLVVLS